MAGMKKGGEGCGVRGMVPAAALVALLTGVAFLPVLGNGFIGIDDPLYLTANRNLAGGLSAGSLRWGATTFHGGNWHPLTWWSHALDISLFGLNPAGHHAVGLLLHAANALLLCLLLAALTGGRGVPLAAALLAMIHPLKAESVAWAAERKDLLAAFFGLLCLLAYVRYLRRRTVGGYALVAMLLALGLAAKPMLVTLPLAMLLLDAWPLGRFPAGRRLAAAGRLLAEKAPLLALAAASSAVTLAAQRQAGWVRNAGPYTWPVKLQNAVTAHAAYLGKIFRPAGLAMPYTHREGGIAAAAWIAATLLLAAIVVAAFLLRRRMPWVAVGWLWFAGMLVPTIGLVQVADQSMADRYTYLPLAGIAWLSAETLFSMAARRRTLAVAAVGAAILVLVPLSWRQTTFWRDDATLFGHAVRVDPENWLAWRNLATTRLGEGRLDEAADAYQHLLDGGQMRAEVLNGLGAVRLAQGRLAEAVAYLEAALRLDPGFALAYRNLGDAYTRAGERERAAKAYALAMRFSGRTVNAVVSPHAPGAR
jgi:tetratricopeptide (TPR) repeat protein